MHLEHGLGRGHIHGAHGDITGADGHGVEAGAGADRDVTWEQETVELATVGIDVGSATTHVTFARIFLQRVGQMMSDRYTVVRRDVEWQSPVSLTPYLLGEAIDAEAVGAFVERAYIEAGRTPADVDTGAVLLTGTALLRANSHALTDALAEYAGGFVCAAAGHHLEALLAAHGSGAADLPEAKADGALLLDIGGGTAKFAWIDRGAVSATAAIGIGGRLVTWDANGVIDRLEPYAVELAGTIGQDLQMGAVLHREDRARLIQAMAVRLVDAVQGSLEELPAALVLTPWPDDAERSTAGAVADRPVVLSGGVAEYLRLPPALGAVPADPRDLGADLSVAVRAEFEHRRISWRLAPAAIRATVLGAAGFSVDVSGNTVYLSESVGLPLRDVPVAVARVEAGQPVEQIATAIATALAAETVRDGVAAGLFLDLHGEWLTYRQVHALAVGLATGWRAGLPGHDVGLIVVMQPDLARSLGRIADLECDLPGPIVSLDGIRLSELDFIDVGPEQRGVHPVMIKSLIFDQVHATA